MQKGLQNKVLKDAAVCHCFPGLPCLQQSEAHTWKQGRQAGWQAGFNEGNVMGGAKWGRKGRAEGRPVWIYPAASLKAFYLPLACSVPHIELLRQGGDCQWVQWQALRLAALPSGILLQDRVQKLLDLTCSSWKEHL